MFASCHNSTELTRNKPVRCVVPGGGVEPPRPEGRRILSPLRLPVPPSRLYVEVLYFKAYLVLYSLAIKNNECETV